MPLNWDLSICRLNGICINRLRICTRTLQPMPLPIKNNASPRNEHVSCRTKAHNYDFPTQTTKYVHWQHKTEKFITSCRALDWPPQALEAFPEVFLWTGPAAVAGTDEATVSCWITCGPNAASTALRAMALPVPKAMPLNQEEATFCQHYILWELFYGQFKIYAKPDLRQP